LKKGKEVCVKKEANKILTYQKYLRNIKIGSLYLFKSPLLILAVIGSFFLLFLFRDNLFGMATLFQILWITHKMGWSNSGKYNDIRIFFSSIFPYHSQKIKK